MIWEMGLLQHVLTSATDLITDEVAMAFQGYCFAFIFCCRIP